MSAHPFRRCEFCKAWIKAGRGTPPVLAPPVPAERSAEFLGGFTESTKPEVAPVPAEPVAVPAESESNE